MSMPSLLLLASEIANLKVDRKRKAFIGAIAIRKDGVLVSTRNGGTCAVYARKAPSCHAEAKLMRKAGVGSVVYVARVKRDGVLAMAKPCGRCMAQLRSKRVKLVYYTIADKEWGSCEP